MYELGGPKRAKEELLAKIGPNEKMTYLRQFRGIGPKYARNIMMDVYHKDFRDSIAVDSRIKSIANDYLGLNYTIDECEKFFLEAASEAKISGWEMDRLLYNFQNDFINMILTN